MSTKNASHVKLTFNKRALASKLQLSLQRGTDRGQYHITISIFSVNRPRLTLSFVCGEEAITM